MKWITNTEHPEDEINKLTEFDKRKLVIGRPDASDVFTVAQMEDAGIVGIYEEET